MSISLSAVLEEVAQTTGYTGSKMDADANAYERIATVDEDHSELMRFWNESRSEVAKAFIRMLVSEGMSDSDTYRLSLRVPSSFDTSLLPSMRVGLFSYFVQSITARWFGYTNKGESDINVARSLTLLDELRRKAFYKRVPSSGGGDDGGGDKPRTLTHADISDWDAATRNFLREHQDLSGYATKEELNGKSDSAHLHSHADINDWDTATSGFATQQWVQDALDDYDEQYHMSTAYDTATAAATAAREADGKASAAQSAAAAVASAVSQLRDLLSEKADQSAVDELEQAGMELINGLAEEVQTEREKTDDRLDSLKMSDLENDLLPSYRSAEKRNPLMFQGVLPLEVDRNVTANTSYRDIQHPQVYYSPLKGAFGAWVGNVLYTRWSGWEEYVMEQYSLYLNGETVEWWTVLDGRLVKGFHVQPVIDFLKPVLALRVHELQDTSRLMSGFWMEVDGDPYEVGEFREDNIDRHIEVYNTWGETLGENGDGGPCHYAMVELRTALPMTDRWPLLLSNEDGDSGDFRRIFKDSQLNLDNMIVESDDIVLSRLISRKPGHTDRKFKHWVPYKRYAVGELNSYRDEYTAIGRSINLSKTDEATGEGVDKTEDLFALKEIDPGMTKMLPVSSLLQFFPVNIPEREIPDNLVYLCPEVYIEPGGSADVSIHMANVGTGVRSNRMIVNLWQRASLHRELRISLNDQEGNGGTFTVRGEPVTGRLWLKSIKQMAMSDIEDGLEGYRLILSLEFVADR